MNDCLFCKIIAKEIPSVGVYEDDQVYAFLDIHPVQPGHVLVVPKMHSEALHDASPSALQGLSLAIQRVGRAVMDGLGVKGFNLQQNNGTVAGQVIPHLHFHIIPRRENDGLHLWSGKAYAEREAEGIADKIKSGLSV